MAAGAGAAETVIPNSKARIPLLMARIRTGGVSRIHRTLTTSGIIEDLEILLLASQPEELEAERVSPCLYLILLDGAGDQGVAFGP